MRFDWAPETTQPYGGLLTFPSVTDGVTSTTYPAVSIPIFVKEYNAPYRKPKVTEVSTLATTDPYSSRDRSIQIAFFGSGDPLTVTLAGWIITPTLTISGVRVWAPTVDGGPAETNGQYQGPVSTNISDFRNMSYGDLILAYMEGRIQRTSVGRWIRTDPTAYTDPMGHVYNNPVIMSFDCSYGRPNKKQGFNLTMWLEGKGVFRVYD